MKASNLVRKFAFLLLLLILPVIRSQAQSGSAFQGLVLDEITKEVIPYGTVAYYNQDKLITRLSTSDSGRFHLEMSLSPTYK